MIYIADYFALGLVIVLFTFFYDNKTSIRYMPLSSKVFAMVLALTALNAITDLTAGALLSAEGIPVWLNMLVNSLYFIINIVTTSCIALFFFVKILEHTHSRRCKRNAGVALIVMLSLYVLLVIGNVWGGYLFYFDESGAYHRGPLNIIGYFFMFMQMIFVLVCYFRNKETANKLMRRTLCNIFPIIPICILLQRVFPEIMLNSIIIAFVDIVLFMTFMSQRHGVHTLTELNDRHRFFDNVNQLITLKEPFQIFLINLKNFSAINQKYGHIVGDEYLYQFAFSLERTLKDGVAFHMNGTVFAVVLKYTYQSVAERQSGALLDFLNTGIDFDDHHIEVDYIVSHYISCGEETTSTDIFEIMEHSIAKGYGLKQRYVQCNQDIREEIDRMKYLRGRLERIDTARGYEVWYQPIKCLQTGKFCSMEALIRLREMDGSLISPAEFIPLAEKTGQISSITWFVLEQVCHDLKHIPELENTSVSINLPMAQLIEKGFVTRFIGIVDQAGIDHKRICLEFTERTILENFIQTQYIMKELTEAGFRFYLDDFGVGYSNFNCLLQLPFQIIKFDAGLIHDKRTDVYNYPTVQALTRLFHEMDLIVVAEGAETTDEVKALESVGVDRVQGYVFARPMPKDELIGFYKKQLSYPQGEEK